MFRAARRLRTSALAAGAASALVGATVAQAEPAVTSGRWVWPSGTSTAAVERQRWYSRDEVANHTTPNDCWIIIGDRVYDVSTWLARHPGRPGPILAVAGMDATEQFRHFHSKEVFEQYAGEFEIGEVIGGALEVENNATARWHEGAIEEFDYVIVGAGSAGCLVTRRLCQAGFSVCLLEAGGRIAEDTTENVNDPMKYGAAFGTSLNWGYATVAQPGAGSRHIRCTRGRGVGGCSLVNGMLYNRGAREIYDIGWGQSKLAASQQIVGETCSESDWPWSADLCLPYFKVHEDNSRGSTKWHGSGGEVRISDIPDRALSPIAKAFHTAAQQAGHDPNPDQNSLAKADAGASPSASGGEQLGVQIFQCFVDERIGDGRRVTASRAFLPNGAETVFEPRNGAGGAGDLTLHSHCTAAEIVLNDPEQSIAEQATTRARGVRYLTEDGAPATALARRETIVCAGVIGSPQLLLLSGIGPRSAFERPDSASSESITYHYQGGSNEDNSSWKWPQCKGRHLMDHPRVACRWESKLDGLDLSSCFSHVEGCLYARSNRAQRAASAACASVEAQGRVSQQLLLDAVPDIQIQQDHVRTNDDMLADPPLSTGFNLKPHVAQPRSEGTVELISPDPREKPRIDPKYLSDPDGDDLRCLVEGVRAARNVVAQQAFNGIRGVELLPGADVVSDHELEAWVIQHVDTGYHPVGTCRMSADPTDGVVDGSLKVYGVDRLRVVDASIMPHIPNGNTQAPTFMVAEKAVEMIIDDAVAAD